MKSAGFTLVEVLVAIVILAVGLVAVIEAMGRTQQALGISRNLVAASMAAEERLADAEIEVLQAHELRYASDRGSYQVPGKQFDWTRQISVYRHPSIEDETRLNEVGITVRWKEGGRPESNLQLHSLILNREKTA